MSCQECAAGSPKRTCARTCATCRQLFASGNLQRGSGSTPVPATQRTTAAEAPQPGKTCQRLGEDTGGVGRGAVRLRQRGKRVRCAAFVARCNLMFLSASLILIN